MKGSIEDILMVVVAVVVGIFATLLVILEIGCGAGLPFDPCSQPAEVRCDGDEIQHCEGGHWYPAMDCTTIGQTCVTLDGEPQCEPDGVTHD